MKTVALSLALVLSVQETPRHDGETQYNGIKLPAEWPPRLKEIPQALPTPPYLASPPDVIPIDVGRQLFVDDFLIEETTMSRRFHKPAWHPSNPVLKPETPWEKEGLGPMALPYSGGVFHDPADRKFKIWYMGGYLRHLCLAVSDDGVTWTRPDFGVIPGTNVVLPGGATESNTLWLDLASKDPGARYKFFVFRGGGIGQMRYQTSADGIHWGPERWKAGDSYDRTTVFHNPFRQKWVFLVRDMDSSVNHGRIKRYWEVSDLSDAAAVNWGKVDNAPLWVAADWGKDLPRHELMVGPQLYNLDCVPYESLILGMFSILRGDFDLDRATGRAIDTDRPKCCEVGLGFTRDGFHWYRPDPTPFLGMSERRGDWNWGNVQAVGGGCIVVGDQLYFYVGGRAGKSMPGCPTTWAGGSTGLAILRRDGFASMDATGGEKALTTRKLRFSGRRLFVNVDAPDGELRAEVLDASGKPLAPFTRENCVPVRVNRTLQEVRWKGVEDLSKVAGQDVRFRFTLKNGSLYAFWASPDSGGASLGFVAAGGPGLASNRDTAGRGSYPGNLAPLAKAGEDRTVRDTAARGSVTVSLDGSATLDPDGRVVSYEWLKDGAPVASGAKAGVTLPVGAHTLVLAATDDQGAVGYDSVAVTVLPGKEPVPPRRGLTLWLKADAIEGVSDGGRVAEWPDGSASRLDVFQKEESRRPAWQKSAANGKPALVFDGVDDHLVTGFTRGMMFTYGPATLFAVFRPENAIETRTLFGQDYGSFSTMREGGAGLLGYSGLNGSTLRNATPQLRPGAWTLGALLRSGPGENEARLYVNGRQNDNGVAVPYHKVNSNAGAIGCGRGGTYFWKGGLAEVLIYGEALSEEERRAVEQYLAGKYGIPLELKK